MDNPLNKKLALSNEPAVIAMTAAKPLSIASEQLLGTHGVAFIIHQGERYQLRQTKAGKLMLTK
ncbi:hemin uptake protein HemP [Chania multitudinisentens]|uniref:hemin uptake protein HemP n=1 Tax=Chania multitudinisentens TaxID=1639108 RepID=UPI0003E15369|nr:hemin uptake protein HemP [Chania multitudinisentens]